MKRTFFLFFTFLLLISFSKIHAMDEFEIVKKIFSSEGIPVTPLKRALTRVVRGTATIEEIKSEQEQMRRELAEEKERQAQETISSLTNQVAEAKVSGEKKQQEVDSLKIKLSETDTRLKEFGAREKKKQQELDALQAQLKDIETLRQELLSAVTSVQTGQAYVIPDSSDYIPYGGAYIHTEKLKEPDSSLDDQKRQKIGGLRTFVMFFSENVQASRTFKSLKTRIHKTRVLQQIERLQEELDNFEVSTYVTVFRDVKANLSDYETDPAFIAIAENIQWLEENGEALSEVEEHRFYKERQIEAEKIVLAKAQKFNEFYDYFLDKVVEDVCLWLAPTEQDGENTKLAKRDFALKLRISSIPVIKEYLQEKTKFGTMDSFLTQTFTQACKGKEFAKFKGDLDTYASLFRDLGKEAKLVEELLNYMFFQNRYRVAQLTLASLKIDQIRDRGVKKVLLEMRDKEVLFYGELATKAFAKQVQEALKEYSGKKSINPDEMSIEKQVINILGYYVHIHEFSECLATRNPIMRAFHEK